MLYENKAKAIAKLVKGNVQRYEPFLVLNAILCLQLQQQSTLFEDCLSMQ